MASVIIGFREVEGWEGRMEWRAHTGRGGGEIPSLPPSLVTSDET